MYSFAWPSKIEYYREGDWYQLCVICDWSGILSNSWHMFERTSPLQRWQQAQYHLQVS